MSTSCHDAFGHRSHSVSGEVKKSSVPGLPSRNTSYSSACGYRSAAHRVSSSSNGHANQCSGQQMPELLIELDTVDCLSNPSGDLQRQNSQGNSRFVLPPASLESTTSSSILHGIVLICIMVSSLISFALSLLSEVCDDHFNVNCSTNSLYLYSLASMTSCLFCFVIYFLHLIGHCDYGSLCAKRKIIAEIVATLLILVWICVSVTSMVLHTTGLELSSSPQHLNFLKNRNVHLKNNVNSGKSNLHSSLHNLSGTMQAAVISTCTAILCYILRILSLVREWRMLANKQSTRTSQATSPTASFKVFGRVNELTNRVTDSIRSFKCSVTNSPETSL